MTFENLWSDLQHRLQPGTAIPSWSVAGRARTKFHVSDVNPDSVLVVPESGEPRRVAKSEFAKIYELWPAYIAGRAKRHELRDVSQNTTYILSLIHWHEG